MRGSWIEHRHKGLGEREFVLKSDCANLKEYRAKVSGLRARGWLIRNVKGGVVAFEFVRDYENWRANPEDDEV